MAKSSTGSMYRCAACGWHSTKWSGRCGGCQEWGTVEQVAVAAAGRARSPLGRSPLAPAAVAPDSVAIPLSEVDAGAASARPSGLDELDRVLGGGLVPGA